MSRAAKAGIVCSGYVLALAAGFLASHLYNVRMAAMPYDTSGGMYAAGDMMSALAAFLVVALVPTLLALWFLRRSQAMWRAIALGSIAFAGVGLLAVLMPLAIRDTGRSVVLMLLSLLGLAQLLGVPLWTVAFVLFALLAPAGWARRLLFVAVGLELAIGVCAAIHWLVPRPPF